MPDEKAITVRNESIISGPKIAAKIIRLMELVGRVPKDKTNDFFHYKYTSDEAISSAIQKACIEAHVAAVPNFFVDLDSIVKTRQGNDDRLIRVGVTLNLMDADSGETAIITALGSGQDASDKAEMKAETAALKYAWMKLLNIPTGDDPEADKRTDQQMNVPAPNQKPIEKPTPSTAIPKPTLQGDAGSYTDTILKIALSKSKKSHVVTTKSGLLFGVKSAEAVKEFESAIKDGGTYDITWICKEFKGRSFYWASAIEKVYPQQEKALDDLFGPKEKPAIAVPSRSDTQSPNSGVTVVNDRKFGNFTIQDLRDVEFDGIKCVLIQCARNHDFYTPDKNLIDVAVECMGAKCLAAIVALKTDFGWRVEAIQRRVS